MPRDEWLSLPCATPCTISQMASTAVSSGWKRPRKRGRSCSHFSASMSPQLAWGTYSARNWCSWRQSLSEAGSGLGLGLRLGEELFVRDARACERALDEAAAALLDAGATASGFGLLCETKMRLWSYPSQSRPERMHWLQDGRL